MEIQQIDYIKWLKEIKQKIKVSQIKATLSVNTELIQLYIELGRQINNKQKKSKWGSGFIKQLSSDLRIDFPDIGGFSESNLRLCRRFYLFYYEKIEIKEQLVPEIKNNIELKREQAVLKIPWGHHILILKKIRNKNEALFYIEQTLNNNWSRSVLGYQIETQLYKRQGKVISNVKRTMPKPDSDLAQQLIKDPYNFDFINLTKRSKEKDLELKLVQNITNLLLELGTGFAYLGRQFRVKVGAKEYKTDLLFYHTKLRAYVIIELKLTEFEPEFIGKLNFYISAINEYVKSNDDKPTIGILLCKEKDDFIVDFALKDVNKPIGVSQFTYTELPDEIKNALPSKEALKKQLQILK